MKKVRKGNTQGVALAGIITAAIVLLLVMLISFTKPPVSQAIPFDSDGYDYFALQDAALTKDAARAEQIKQEARESVSSSPAPTTEQTVPTEKSASLISTDYFEFTLPAYWKDRVTVVQETDGGITIYANGLPENRLISLNVVDASNTVVGGDIGNSNTFHKENGKGQRIELWMTNYAWIVFSENRPDVTTHTEWAEKLLDPTIAKEVVALQTLGALDAEQIIKAAQAGEDEFADQDAWFNAVNAIIPTIVVK